MTKTQMISSQILNLVSAGKPVREAVDQILGEGTFLRIANEVYEELKREPAAKLC